MLIDKFISYQIETQFPALYRESGPEMVALVKSYYEFLENSTNQATHNSRRLFEYRDIDNTLEQLLIFFKNKYLKDLPLDESTIRLTLKRILNLYRRKGTQEGIELFFRMFYDETVKVYYPSSDILKPSDSIWSVEKYIQLYPINPFNLRNLLNKEIYGNSSNAAAVVENTFFLFVNGVMIPIIYVSNIRGTFTANESIFYTENGKKIDIGIIFGSMDSVSIEDSATFAKTNNHFIGEIITIQSSGGGIGGKLLVTGVSDIFRGEIQYTLTDGGWGYSRENTLLLVSNQVIFLPEENFQSYEPLERLDDQLGNAGTVIGQRGNILGVRMDPGAEFVSTSMITDSNGVEVIYDFLGAKNDTTPGPLLPESPSEPFPVQVDTISNTQTIFLITDIIGDYVDVSLNSSNFNDPPAAKSMSGTADPVTLSTQLDSAFQLEGLQIGTIDNFKFLNPGEDIINEVFALVYDPVVASFARHDQILSLTPSETVPNAFNFRVGTFIQQGPVIGKILKVEEFFITVRVYNFSGFDAQFPITYNGLNYNISAVSRDYTSKVSGFNAVMRTNLNFVDGQITDVKVINSGYGYANNSVVTLIDQNGLPAALGRITANGIAEAEGKWIKYNSHIGTEFNKRIQDSNYYQSYSYEIRSKLDINNYEKVYKDIMHTAGTKLFSKFDFEDVVDPKSTINIVIE